MRYEDASNSQNPVGSNPEARADIDALNAGDLGPASGNVITGAGTITGPAGADSVPGGEGQIVALKGNGGTDSSASDGSLQVRGRYGELTVETDGDYSYTRNSKDPNGVSDVFTYTLADAAGEKDQATLTIDIRREIEEVRADAQQLVPGPDGVVVLPAGVQLSDIRVIGSDLVIIMPDGSQMVIPNGAVFVPQLVIGDVQVPPTNLAALLIDAEPQPASGTPQSSGGNFGLPVSPLDPGIPLGDLIPPTELVYVPPEFRDAGQFEDEEPEAGAISAQLDDDALAGGNAGGTGDDPDSVNASGVLPGSGGDGDLTWSLLLTGAPAGFAYVDGPGDSILVQQGGVTVLTITVNPATGAYTVVQNAVIDHAAGNDENNVEFVINYTITDEDGDVAAGSLTVNVDDDTPVATANSVGGTVDEDGVPGGIAGGTGDVAGENTVVTGSVTSLFSAGADAPLTYSLSTNTAGLPALTSNGVAVTYAVVGNVLTASAGGSPVFTLALNADGSFTFTLLDQLDHPAGNNENDLTLALGSIIVATDADGDPVNANANGLVITVDDDTPIAVQGEVGGTVDEDGVPGGIAGGVGDVAGESAVATGSVAMLFQSGADAPLSFGLLADTSGLPALTSNGVAVTYAVSGNTLTASAGGNTVFTFTLNANGSWTFTLVDQLDHAEGNNENDLTIDLSSILQATDADGDSVSALVRSLVITVDDDTPAPSENQITGTVDEDGVPGGIAGGVGDVAGESAVATGSITGLFNPGADAPLSFSLAADTSGLPALTSNGVAVTYAVVGNTLTASAGGTDVFTLVLNEDGSFTFTLLDQLDHDSLDGEEGDDTENDLSIDLSSIVQAVDADGDPISAGEGAFVITVDDDTPTASGSQVTGTVDEDGVTAGIAGGTGDVAGEATIATGSVTTLFNSGADAPLSYSLLTNTAGLPVLTSGGVAITYAVVGDTLTASAGGTDVFTFTLNADGTWEFELLDQIDHPTLNGMPGDDTENDLTIDLSSIIQATDADGDSVTANANGLVVTVDDDTPGQNGTVTTVFVDEDALPGGNEGGPADGPGGIAGPIGVGIAILFASGADQPLTVSMSTNTSGLPALTSNGVAVTYAVVGNTLTASAGGNDVFTIVLDPNTGIATFTLLDQLDHPSQDGTADDNTENNLVLDFSSLFIGTDADGDSITLDAGSYLVNVDDDTPTASTAQVTGTVDEDGVREGASDNGPGDGIAGGTGDVAGEATVATGSVATLFNPGADQPLTYSLLTNTAGLPALTSNNVAVTYAVVGNTLTASAGGETVFTFVLNADGTWTFTLVDQLDHAEGNNENDLSINLSSLIQATDADGDSVVAGANGLIITVDDDTPIATGAQVTGTVDEDGVLEGAADGGDGDGIAGGTGDVAGEATVATGSVTTLFQSGADAPLSYSLSVNTGGLPALTSAGVAVTYAVVGNTLTASAGGETVFTFVLNANGTWTFTLVDQIDHPTLNGMPGDDTENDLTIDLSSIIQATDADGDSVTANANGLVITVDDDTPVARNDTDSIVSGGDTATGNVITGVGTDSGAAGADDTGADAPATITGLVGAVTSDTNPAGGFVAEGDYGVLTMQADGSYSYDRNDGSPGDVEDVFTYSYTDRDGDTVTATLTISISDDAPVLTTPPAILLDDDDVVGAGGNPGGPNDDVPTTASGTLSASGGDGDVDFFFSVVQPALPAGFTFNQVNSTTMQILQGATVVLTITLNNESGAYSVVQNNPIDHDSLDGMAGDNTENNIGPFNVSFFAEDSDGDDSNAVNLAITVDDDTPVATATQLTGTVDEDGVLEGAADQGPGDGIAGGTGDVAGQDVTATGSVTTLFSIGADKPGTYSLLSNFAGLTAQNLTSGGVALVYAVQFAGGVYTLTATAGMGGDTVFTFTLNASTGAYNFTLVDQLDHATLNGGAGDNTENDLTINLSSIIQVTDFDGDSIVAGPNGLIITVDDDTPIATTAQVTGTVDEDGVVEDATVGIQTGDGIAGGTGDVAGEITIATGSVATLFQSGADEPLTYSLSTVTSGLPALTSGGNTVTYAVVGNTLTASAGGETVFTFVLNANGTWTFTLFDQLDHATLNGIAGDDTENDLTIQLGSIIQATDRDGDTVTANSGTGQGLLITVDDDSPKVNNVTDPLQIENTGDTPSGTGAFDFDIGADENFDFDDISVSGFRVFVNGEELAMEDFSLTPGAETATHANYTFTFDYDTGSGATATATGTLVFNKSDGTYTVTLTSGPIEGFSILQTSAGTLFQGYEFGTSTLDGSQPEISVTQIRGTPGDPDPSDLFVQFTSVSEPSSGTGDDNLEVTDWVPGADNPPPVDGGGDDSWSAGQVFNQDDGWVSTSNDANGVDGDTIQGGEVLDFTLVQGANPTGVLADESTYGQASSMFLKFDGIGSGEDMIVILKLYDPVLDIYTTRAVMVENADIQKGPGTGPGIYSGITLDQNDGLVIIESNDYNLPGENWVIVGAQIAGSDEGVTGTAIDLNSAINVDLNGDGDFTDPGESSGDSDVDNDNSLDTQPFSDDVNNGPFKISSIGFVTEDTADQNATLEFDVTIEDADGDKIVVEDVTVNIGDTSGNTLAAESLSTKSTTTVGEAYEQQKAANDAGNTVLLGAIAAAGLAAMPAAAHNSPGGDGARFDNADAISGGQHVAASIESADSARSALGGETKVAADSAPEASASASAAPASDDGGNTLTGAANDDGPAPTELLEGTEAPTQSDAASITAPSVAMPSAEMLQAAASDGDKSAVAGDSGEANSAAEIAQVIADALEGGAGGDIDALLQGLPGDGQGVRGAIEALASHAGADVQGWDMGAAGIFPQHAIFSMDAVAMHQDAGVQQA